MIKCSWPHHQEAQLASSMRVDSDSLVMILVVRNVDFLISSNAKC